MCALLVAGLYDEAMLQSDCDCGAQRWHVSIAVAD